MVDMAQWNGIGDTNATFILLLKNDIRRLLINADPESLELVFDDSFLRERFIDVQDDEDQMAGFGHCDDLSAATLSILGPLDNSRQIQHLNRSTIVYNLAGDSSQGREFIRRGYPISAGASLHRLQFRTFGVLSGQSAHERAFSHRRKPDKTNTGHASPGNIKASCTKSDSHQAHQAGGPPTTPASSA